MADISIKDRFGFNHFGLFESFSLNNNWTGQLWALFRNKRLNEWLSDTSSTMLYIDGPEDYNTSALTQVSATILALLGKAHDNHEGGVNDIMELFHLYHESAEVVTPDRFCGRVGAVFASLILQLVIPYRNISVEPPLDVGSLKSYCSKTEGPLETKELCKQLKFLLRSLPEEKIVPIIIDDITGLASKIRGTKKKNGRSEYEETEIEDVRLLLKTLHEVVYDGKCKAAVKVLVTSSILTPKAFNITQVLGNKVIAEIDDGDDDDDDNNIHRAGDELGFELLRDRFNSFMKSVRERRDDIKRKRLARTSEKN